MLVILYKAVELFNFCVFQIDNLFCLGSPLSVFLALRMRDPQAPGQVETILPPSLCKKFYNVFHPTDPVAYRCEYFYIKPTSILSFRMTELTLKVSAFIKLILLFTVSVILCRHWQTAYCMGLREDNM